jgi:hypothetical protein
MTLPAGSQLLQFKRYRRVSSTCRLAVVKPSPPRFSKAKAVGLSDIQAVMMSLLLLFVSRKKSCSVKKQPPIKSDRGGHMH